MGTQYDFCTRKKTGLLRGNAENMAAGQLEQYGWSNFFDELTTFLVDIDRNTGTLSERYTEHVLERIPVCLRAIRQIILVLNTDVEMTEDETDIVQYIEELNTLFSSLCVIASEWERHRPYYSCSFINCLQGTIHSCSRN